MLNVPVWDILASCSLTIQSNEGNGGDVSSGGTHVGGAGGGMGDLVFS